MEEKAGDRFEYVKDNHFCNRLSKVNDNISIRMGTA